MAKHMEQPDWRSGVDSCAVAPQGTNSCCASHCGSTPNSFPSARHCSCSRRMVCAVLSGVPPPSVASPSACSRRRPRAVGLPHAQPAAKRLASPWSNPEFFLIEAGSTGPPYVFPSTRLPHLPATTIGIARRSVLRHSPFGTRRALAFPLRTFATTRARPAAPRVRSGPLGHPRIHWKPDGALSVARCTGRAHTR